MSRNPLKLRRIHHIEFYVGNAKQAAFYYRLAFGFSPSAYAGLETGSRDAASYVLTQNKIQFALTTPLSAKHPATDFLDRHGDGVKDIAFEVNDVDGAFEAAVDRGAIPEYGAKDLRRRLGPSAESCNSNLWRHDSLTHFDPRLLGSFLARLPTFSGSRRLEPAFSWSITLWEMSSWERWNSGPNGTPRSWDSSATSVSMTKTFRPSTALS